MPPRNRRPFFTLADELAGMPDGMCVDAEGGLWVALWGGSCVLGLTPDGELHTQIELPTNQVTSVAFGGDDLRTLYITSAAFDLDEATLAAEPHAGGIFTADVGVAGLAERRPSPAEASVGAGPPWQVVDVLPVGALCVVDVAARADAGRAVERAGRHADRGACGRAPEQARAALGAEATLGGGVARRGRAPAQTAFLDELEV